jgi:hypothetical protein
LVSIYYYNVAWERKFEILWFFGVLKNCRKWHSPPFE